MFATLVFLMGGGSRYDISSIGPLRAIAVLVLALALWFQKDKTLRRVKTPLLFLLFLAGWMVLQLVPLPPGLWSSLHGREEIYAVGQVAGVGDVWRPITFSPAKTLNSLASLVVPAAGLLVLSHFDDHGWRRLSWVVIIAGTASALFGIGQMLLPESTGLYLYDITNRGSAVGLFSNRNHNAMFLTIALIFCVVRLERLRSKKIKTADVCAAIAALIIFACLLVNASRSGLAGMGIVGLVFAVRAGLDWRAGVARSGRMIAGAVVGVVSLALVGLFALLGQSPAVERLLEHDAADDQRLQSLPYVLDMVADFQPFGVGMGAFEQAFYTIEPVELLRDRYLNHAHNDWLQFPIEAGLPGVIILLLALAVIIMRIMRIARSGGSEQVLVTNAWLGILTLMVFALGSLIDYPLRTPSLMLVAAVALAMMFKPMANASKD